MPDREKIVLKTNKTRLNKKVYPMRNRMKKKLSNEDICLMKKALSIIEELSVNTIRIDTDDSSLELNEAMSKCYQIAHTINNPNCRKNHPEWIKIIENWVME